MNFPQIAPNIWKLGVIDWDRRLFDSLIPLPDGTSYNAYLVRGNEKTALLDTVDAAMPGKLLEQLAEVKKIDYVIAHHAEQDHSGAIPAVLARYPGAVLVCSTKCKAMLVDHLCVDEKRICAMENGATLPLGGKTLEFIYTPWVHWPETMCTYCKEDKVLFTCDFFGSHLATSDAYSDDKERVYEAAKRYYAEIMMPFRAAIRTNIAEIEKRAIAMIAPSHGPVHRDPQFIVSAYKDWISDTPKNIAVIPYISMHGSTRAMVDRLVAALTERKITVHQFDLSVTDLGKLAITLVDAATIVIGTPTVHVGPHPTVAYAVSLANALRPKAKFASIIGSYGWAGRTVEQIAAAIPNLKVEVLEPLMCKGYPREKDFAALDRLADAIASKHRALGIL
ncbi:MAG: FprA family A-type flavoprotein [Chitinispirillaceae bacterium]|jgi:flavorubredoxin